MHLECNCDKCRWSETTQCRGVEPASFGEVTEIDAGVLSLVLGWMIVSNQQKKGGLYVIPATYNEV